MTPSALTPAARGTTKKPRPEASSRPSAARGSGHRSNVRRSVAPAAPRRVSGPAGGTVLGGVIAVPAPGRARPTRERPAPSRERTAPSRERPAPSRRRSRTAVGATTRAPWRLRTAAQLRALPDHVLLDRIIRGRVWIPLLGVLLAGIVFMQVEVLKLNAGIGRSLERGSALQAQNELLRAGVSRLSDEQRIERMAAQMGMVMPAPEQLRFVKPGTGATQRALGSVHAPDATTFIAQLPTAATPAAPQGTSVTTDVGLAPTGAASTTSATDTPATTSTSAGTSGTTADPSVTSVSSTGTPADTSAGTTATGTTDAGTTSATGASAPQSTPPAPVAPTTAAGTTDQPSSSSSGGAGAMPVGG
jgi:hypothetical protein